MTSKFALVIANTEYQDASFAKLTAPGKDAEEFAHVLREPELAGFDDVQVLINEGEGKTRRWIARFFAERKRDDLLLLYFSGHGVRNEQGQLFLAANDTEMNILEASGIPADFVTHSMNNSRSQRQLLILDCCNSGAFAHGSKSASGLGNSMGIATAFEGNGFGRMVLTATDATQYAWEGEKVIGNTQKSVFTHFLIEGLNGEADRDGDGCINVDELYDYAYEQVVRRTPKQTPGKWSYRQQGDIILRENLKPRNEKPASPPIEVIESVAQPLKVFLCHSSSDKSTVHELYRQLNAEGWIDVWLDEEKLLPGQDWDMEIETAVESADVVIVCLSNSSISKEGYIQREMKFALDIALEKPEGAIFVIPLKLDNCSVPRRLREWQWVDYFPDDQKPIAYTRLLKSLKKRANKLGDLQESPKPNLEVIARKSFAYRIAVGVVGVLLFTLFIWGGGKLFNSLSPIPEPTQTDQPINTQILEPSQTSAIPTIEFTLSPVTSASEIAPFVIDEDGMALILIPAGDFSMGSKGFNEDERPVHNVYLDAFLIDKTEVTNAMYAACVNSGKCESPRANISITQNESNHSFYYGNPNFDNYPVIYVSWSEAKKYCESVGRRLPTEAEWEKAASWDDAQGLKRIYPWGNTVDCSYTNYYNDEALCVGDTKPVGSYLIGASFYGVLDMAGNVWEWVADRYDPEYYGNSAYSNPNGPTSGDFIVIRGGSFLVGGSNGIRSSYREKISPDVASHNIGFRCSVDAP